MGSVVVAHSCLVASRHVESSWKERKKQKSLSRVLLFATPRAVAYQAPPSMEFSREEYWNGLPFPSPGDLPDSGIEPGTPALQADALPSEPPGPRIKPVFPSLAGGFLCLSTAPPGKPWKGILSGILDWKPEQSTWLY